MFYVYVLYAQMRHVLYIGVTNDLRKRLKEHAGGRSTYTRRATWKLVYYEAYAHKEDARTRERTLKEFGSAYGHLKKRISKSIAIQKGGIQ